MKVTCLQDLTGQESGAVYYPASEEIWIGNWSGFDGLPRVLAPLGTLGLTDRIVGTRTATPECVKQAMQEHERAQGDDISRTGWRAWTVNDGEAIVVINRDWN